MKASHSTLALSPEKTPPAKTPTKGRRSTAGYSSVCSDKNRDRSGPSYLSQTSPNLKGMQKSRQSSNQRKTCSSATSIKNSVYDHKQANLEDDLVRLKIQVEVDEKRGVIFTNINKGYRAN